MENADQYIPYSQEAEEAVLGAILVNGSAFKPVSAILATERFFLHRHQYVFEAMRRVHERGDVVEYLTVTEELRAMGKLDEIGGTAYLTQLINATPTSLHAEMYARIVERAAVRRQMLAAADRIKLLALDQKLTVEGAYEEGLKEYRGVAPKTDSDTQTFQDMVSAYMTRVETLMQQPGTLLGIPTGFTELDALLLGLQRTDLLFLAGRPGMGKTSLLVCIMLAAARLGKRVGFFTMEMGREQIVARILSTETEINLQRIQSGNIQSGSMDWSKFVAAVGNVAHFRVFIDDRPGLSPYQMETRIQEWQQEHGLDLVIVDYLGLMEPGGRTRLENRNLEMSYYARSLKRLAKEYRIPVLCAAQLSRRCEQRDDKRPILSDLRDSGDIEAAADIVMFLYRDVQYDEDADPNAAELIVAKHRNGPTGTVNLYFNRASTKFHNPTERTIDLKSYSDNGYSFVDRSTVEETV